MNLNRHITCHKFDDLLVSNRINFNIGVNPIDIMLIKVILIYFRELLILKIF